jgi:hypothetical protein
MLETGSPRPVKKSKAALRALPWNQKSSRKALDHLDPDSLNPPGGLLDIKGYVIQLLQAEMSVIFDAGFMKKKFPFLIGFDKAEAFLGVIPFYTALMHRELLSLY